MSQMFPHWKRTVPQFRITYWERSATHLCGWHRWVNCLEKIIETWSISDKVDLRATPSSLVPFRINEHWTIRLWVLTTVTTHWRFRHQRELTTESLSTWYYGCHCPRKKKMFWGTRNRWKFLLISSKSRLFRGTKNARNSIPSKSTEG